MIRTHILEKENFVSSKAGIVNQFNKAMAAPEDVQNEPQWTCTKKSQVYFSPKDSCLHHKTKY